MSVYRKCSRCRSPKGSPFNWWSISDLYRHLFRVCRFVKCRKYRSLNNNLGHISLQNPWAVSFSRILVQGCFCQRWSSPGVSWPHVKVRSSESFLFSRHQLCDYISMLKLPVAPGFATSYAGLVTLRAFLGLVEGPLTPGIYLILSTFYTRKELSLRYVAGLLFLCRPTLHWLSRIAFFFTSASVRCEVLNSNVFPLSSSLSCPVLFPGYSLQQSRTWMALVEDRDGPGFLFLYV